jgi:hypothetical protein
VAFFWLRFWPVSSTATHMHTKPKHLQQRIAITTKRRADNDKPPAALVWACVRCLPIRYCTWTGAFTHTAFSYWLRSSPVYIEHTVTVRKLTYSTPLSRSPQNFIHIVLIMCQKHMYFAQRQPQEPMAAQRQPQEANVSIHIESAKYVFVWIHICR